MKKHFMLTTVFLALGLVACKDNSNTHSGERPFAIAIHGGAGTILRKNMSPEREEAYRQTLAYATEAGYAVLEEGGTSTDAIQAAIQIMEESPLFNAGRGAVYTYEGRHELDASIMLGATGEAGAVAGVTNIKSPIAAARAVLEQSDHVMLSGQGAEDFARYVGLEYVSNTYFNTTERYEQLQKAVEALRKKEALGDQIAFNEAWDPNYNMGTVGAVALDRYGHLAAGTSTGGMTAKRWGRIGDSPVIGAGTWADNESCAVSATGHGEYFIRFNVAADICARVKYQGKNVQQASHEVIHEVLLPAGGTGGVIVLDTQGNISMPFNTEGMYRAAKSNTNDLVVKIYAE